jgi:uncharacterized membrane protein
MHWYWDGGAHVAWMGIWWVFGAAVFLAFLWAAAASNRRTGSGGDSPEKILKRRYAKGEIDHDTFLRMLNELRG